METSLEFLVIRQIPYAMLLSFPVTNLTFAYAGFGIPGGNNFDTAAYPLRQRVTIDLYHQFSKSSSSCEDCHYLKNYWGKKEKRM